MLGVVAAVVSLLTWPLWRPAVLPAQPPPVSASAAVPSSRTVPLSEAGIRSVLLIGQVESSQQGDHPPRPAGSCRKSELQPGDRITGMTLAVLDDTDQKLALAPDQGATGGSAETNWLG
ncbi:MAG: hypothetical protein IPL99_04340 [Candidatus Competibacteraceae bacterium]|nr:hypothetical protein [Candidatus Competibacteraceae bacterium]